jgi:hypothetical protein
VFIKIKCLALTNHVSLNELEKLTKKVRYKLIGKRALLQQYSQMWLLCSMIVLFLAGCTPKVEDNAMQEQKSLTQTQGELTSPIVQQANKDIAGDDLKGKDGPLAKVGFDLALLYREYEAYQTRSQDTSFVASNPTLQVSTSAQKKETYVTIDATAKADTEMLLADLEALGLVKATRFGRQVSGQFPLRNIAAMAMLESLQFARPSQAVSQ